MTLITFNRSFSKVGTPEGAVSLAEYRGGGVTASTAAIEGEWTCRGSMALDK